ncbi:hypothetical protein L914_09292 [Phytophthora nicotianae]|uniref:Uncharacterized protein n=1 Tax=Phytophthora nicotianae TaxID=4792 RepID=W2NCV6_PHYNI|nr:hypothetical protein L916_09333 [Phytophthora nicotianae]ETM45723.1 hypothetical protein L914_09292 [Phytophthora nicotianae]
MDDLASSLEDKEPPTQRTAAQVTLSVPEATSELPVVTYVPPATSEVSQTTQPVLQSTRDVKSSTPRVQEVASTESEPCLAKRLHVSSGSSEFSQTGSFVISKSTKSRGRPQVRKKQGNAEKKQRVERGKRNATKLIQGTLAPVPNLRNIIRLLDNDYTYGVAKRILPNLSIRAVPKTKKSIAGIYTPTECNSDIRFVFPKQFVEKCQAAIRTFCKSMEGCAEDSVGVRVPRFGIFRHRDIVAMDR